MRRISRIIVASGALGTVGAGAVVIWRRNPRIGTTFVNSTVDPILIGRGLAGGASSEIGILEHFGRKSGIRRLTPVYPEPTRRGFRIVVPLGAHSEWARNVVAAGHFRLQLHGDVYELDQPTLVPAAKIDGLPWIARAILGPLGVDYLVAQTFDAKPGTIERVETVAVAEPCGPDPTPTDASSDELTGVPGEVASVMAQH